METQNEMESQEYFLVLISNTGKMISWKNIPLDSVMDFLLTYDPNPSQIVLYKYYENKNLGLILPEEWPFKFKQKKGNNMSANNPRFGLLLFGGCLILLFLIVSSWLFKVVQ